MQPIPKSIRNKEKQKKKSKSQKKNVKLWTKNLGREAGHRGPVGLGTCVISGGRWFESWCFQLFSCEARWRKRKGTKIGPANKAQ